LSAVDWRQPAPVQVQISVEHCDGAGNLLDSHPLPPTIVEPLASWG
jgi:hypothetical protein